MRATDRRALLPHYKPPVTGDDEVFADLPCIHEGLDLLGIQWIENNQWEADDVIASLIAAQPAREHLIWPCPQWSRRPPPTGKT